MRSTYAARRDADAAGQDLLDRRLAACVHVTTVEARFPWEGSVEEADEWLLEARVPAAHVEAAMAHVETAHPYDVPLVEAVSVRVSAAYGAWMASVTGAS